MNFKRSICSCLSILTFAPLPSFQAMKESEPGILEMQDLSADDSSKLLKNDSDSDGYEILDIDEEREKKKLGVHNLVCPICYDDKSLDSTIELKCGHMFHQKCMDACWCNGYFQCPVCRQVFDKLRARIKKIEKLQRLHQNVGMSEEDIRERDTRLRVIDGRAGAFAADICRHFLFRYYTSDAYQLGHEDLECSECDADYGIIFVKRYEGNKEERVPFVVGKRPETNADIVAAIRHPSIRKDFDKMRDEVKIVVSGWSEARRAHYQRTGYDDPSLQNEEANPRPLQNVEENRDRLNDDLECVNNTIRRIYNCLPPCVRCILVGSVMPSLSYPLLKEFYSCLLKLISKDYNVENVNGPIVIEPTEDEGEKK